ncbi:MAG: AIDA repeat-containing protein, partial [Lentisphaeria bacterium]|nr:AIDA repeat-containing protein [Lentisphaeria bacterium]
MAEYIISSGESSNGIILENDTMTVLDGGIATDTTVNSFGRLYVHSGGTANSTMVNYNGRLNVSSGGTANSTTVNKGGSIEVRSGGTANSTTVNPYGYIDISSGGTATEIVENGGHVSFDNGANVMFAPNTFTGAVLENWCEATLHSGTTANSTTVNSNGYLYVSSGGTANSTTVSSGGNLIVSSGGIANSTTVNGGALTVSNGGTANSTTVNDWGYLLISSGGMANSTTINGGDLYISSEGTANSTTVNGGALTVSNGGTANSTTVKSNGRMYISIGGTANSTTVNGGRLTISSGGTATNIIENGGYVDIANGAVVTFTPVTMSEVVLSNASGTIHSNTTAISAMIESGGRLNVYEKGYTDSTTIFSGGIMELFEGGSANHAIIKLGGQLNLSSGATATKATVYSNGVLRISSGATATGVVAASGARMELYAASNTLIGGTSGGKVFEIKDGNVSDFAFENGILNVQDKGNVQALTVGSGGSLTISNGNAADIAIKTQGLFQLSSGTASNVEIESGGTLSVTKGGKLAGIINITKGARVTMSADSELHFDITALTPDKSIAIVNDLSLITGSPDYTFISSDAQIQGKYILARGASSFTGAITIKTQNDDFLGILGVGESFNTSNASYSLSLTSGELALEIGTIKPIITLTGNNTTPVQKATLTASTEPGIDIYFSTDNDQWMKYTGEIAVTDNGTYYFKATDADGNIGTNWICFNNIDKTAPEKPTASATPATITNGDVSVSAVFSNEVTVREYSLDGQTWQEYTKAVTMTENGNVYFRGTDEAGNVSEVTTFEVKNIDKIAPEKPTATADVTEYTSGSVNVTATFSEDSVVKQYSLNGQTWRTYTQAITFSSNGTVSFRGRDEAGNLSEVTIYNVENIFKAPPSKPVVSADITTLTNSDVLVNAWFSYDAVVREYSLDGKTWAEYTEPIRFTKNGSVSFRGKNVAGNESEVAVYEVTNIDKTPPEKPVATADVTEPTNMDVLVTATFSEDSVVKQYSFDCENWGTYPGGVLVGTNLSVYFRGIDAAGNASEAASYEVTNVDRSAPVITLTGDNQTPASEVLLTAETDDGSALYYCVDDSGWKEYTETITVTANGSYSFRATDAAGNTAISEILFANIKITTPVNLVGTADGVSWEYPAGADLYVVNLSTDDFGQVFRWLTDTTAQDLYELPGGTYQWRVMVFDDGEDWAVG